MKLLTLLLLSFVVFNTNAQSLVRFYQNAKVGYKDASGNVVVQPSYEAGSEFREGYAIVLKDRKRGFIDHNGLVAIPFVYDDASLFQNGKARVMQNGKYGWIDAQKQNRDSVSIRLGV